ncbi:MAG: hypothetical protein KDA85_18615, partial [Planctomycetaceae bacterium]|nr:hypothetical protein [Planctomycetaceae bacterium]
MTPTSVPVVIAQRGSGNAGAANPGETVDVLPGGIRVVDIQGTERGSEMLADLKEIRYISLMDPPGQGADVLDGLLRTYVNKAMQEADVRIVLDGEQVLLVVAQVNGQHLDLLVHLYAPDTKSSRPRIVRMWRVSGDMGELTQRMWQRKRITGDVDEAITKLFSEFSKAIIKAKADRAAQEAGETK